MNRPASAVHATTDYRPEEPTLETGRQGNVAVSEAVTLQRARIISGALMGGVAMFAVVASFMILQGTMEGSLPPRAQRYLSIGFVAAHPVLIILPPPLGTAAGRGATGGPEAAFLTQTIVQMAVREGVGLAGIVFSLLAGRIEYVIAFAALSLVAMGIGWPREDALREATRHRPR
jgi:hypothetical protein